MKAAFPIALFLAKGIRFFYLSDSLLMTSDAEWIVSQLFHQGALGVGRNAGGTEMILMIIADKQRRVRDREHGRRRDMYEHRFTWGEELWKGGCPSWNWRRLNIPALGRRIVAP